MADQQLFMVFRQVSESQVNELHAEAEEAAQLKLLQSIFPGESSVVYDFHLMNYHFACDQGFSPDKVSVWLELMALVLHESLDGRLKAPQAFECFRWHLMQHSIQRSPMSIAVFTLDDVKACADFVLKTLCRHLGMYQHVFTPHIDITLNQEHLFKSVFPPVLPLAEGKLVDPLTVSFIDEYVERPIPPEDTADLDEQGEMVEPVLDPAKQLLKDELDKLTKEMEEALRLQDEAFTTKLASIKK
jgi:hypothetical protein